MSNLARLSIRVAVLCAALLPGLTTTTWAQEATPEPTANEDVAQSSAEGVVNVNTASAEELMRLPGIGPSKATAILALRDKLKAFPRLAVLMRVRGIGRKTFAKLRPMLTLEGPTTLQGRPARTKEKKTVAE